MWRLMALYGGSLFILALRVIMVLGPSCRIWEDENGGGQTEAVPLEMVEIKSEIFLKNVLVSPQIKI